MKLACYVHSISYQLTGIKSSPFWQLKYLTEHAVASIQQVRRIHRTMQCHIISAKQNDDVIIATSNILQKSIIKLTRTYETI